MTQRIVLPDGHEYVTAVDVTARWPDVSARLLWSWQARGLLDVVRDPDGQPVRVKVPGRRGPHACLYRWADVVEVDRARRTSGRGRPRGRRTPL